MKAVIVKLHSSLFATASPLKRLKRNLTFTLGFMCLVLQQKLATRCIILEGKRWDNDEVGKCGDSLFLWCENLWEIGGQLAVQASLGKSEEV